MGLFDKGWIHAFSMEPLDVARKKAEERATQLARTAQVEHFGAPEGPPSLNGVFGGLTRRRRALGAFGAPLLDTIGQVGQAVARGRGGLPPVPAAAPAPVGPPGKVYNPKSGLWEAPPATIRPGEVVPGSAYEELIRRRKGADNSILGMLKDPSLYTETAENVLSGNTFVKSVTGGRVNPEDLPGPLPKIVDVAAAPLTLATAGTAGVGGAGVRGIVGNVLKREALETASGVVGVKAGEEASKALPEGTPGPLRVAAGLGAGILAGGAAFKALEHPSETAGLFNRNLARVEGRAGRAPAVGFGIEDVSGGQPGRTSFQLPDELAGAKPRYSYGAKRFGLAFDDERDKALYIVATSEKNSKRHADYLATLTTHYADKTPAEIQEMADAVKARIKGIAKDAPAGELHIPATVEDIPAGPVLEAKPKAKARRARNAALDGAGEPINDPANGGPVASPQPAPIEATPVEAPVSKAAARRARIAKVEAPVEATPEPTPAVETPAAPPPIEPPSAPVPPPPIETPPAAEPTDLLATRPVDQLLEEKAAGPNLNPVGKALEPVANLAGRTRAGRFAGGLVKGTNSSITDARVQVEEAEKNRLATLIPDLVGQKKEQLMAAARDAGLDFELPAGATENGWQIRAGGQAAPVRDVVEGATDAGKAVNAALTEQQRTVLTDATTFLDRANATKEFHGGTVNKVATETGDYWPSKVIGQRDEGGFVEKTASGGQSGRSLRDTRGGARTQATQETGEAAGNVYSNPWDAWEGSARNKLMDAADLRLADIIKPLAVDEQVGFGVSNLKGRHPLLSKKQVTGEAANGPLFLVDQPLRFPSDVASQIDSVLSPSSIGDTAPGRALAKVNSLATPLRAAMDVSSRLNQGLGFFESSPKNVIKAAKGGAQVFWSAIGHPEAYDSLMLGERGRAQALLAKVGITGDAADEWLVQHGQHYAGAGSVDEFVFPKGLEAKPGVGKIIRFSNDDFRRFTNYARATLANDALERAINKGLSGEALSDEMRGALKSVNRMTGWTATKTTGLENIALFAPRYFRSNIEQVVNATIKGGVEGAIARRHLLKLVGVAGALAYGVNTARGFDTDFHPDSGNFLTIRDVFGQDIKPLGPFATLVGGVSGVVNRSPEDVFRFGRAKSSPVISTAISLIKGSTYTGRPLTAKNVIPQLATEAIPFAAQAGLAGAGITDGELPSVGDVARGLGAAALSGIGAQASEVTPVEKRGFRRDDIANKLFGKTYDALSGTDKATVNQDPGIMKLQRDAARRGLDNQDKATQIDTDFRAKIDANDRFLAAGKDDAGNPFSGVDYRKAYDDAAAARAAGYKAIGSDSGGSDVDAYFALRDKATQGNGQVDFDKLDKLQADFVAAHPGVLDELDKAVGARDTPTMQQLRKARAQAKEYYDIPAYAGLTTDQSNRASDVLARAKALAASGQAGGYKDALLKMKAKGDISTEDVTLAVRAQRIGSNPARKKFVTTHPEFATFYKGADADYGEVGAVAASGGGSGQSAFRSSGSGGGGSARTTRGQRRGTRGRGRAA